MLIALKAVVELTHRRRCVVRVKYLLDADLPAFLFGLDSVPVPDLRARFGESKFLKAFNSYFFRDHAFQTTLFARLREVWYVQVDREILLG